MCRHFAYLGPVRPLAALVTDPPHSLYRQSWAPRTQAHGTVNADGFGLGWYPPDDPSSGPSEPGGAPADAAPARYRRAGPIWADPDLPDLLRTLRSHAVLAAVRGATAGTSPEASAAAPFRAGRWLFSHNGAVDAWERLPEDTGAAPSTSALLALEARSDSALLWVLVQDRLAAGEPPGDALATVVRQVGAARPGARLNLLLTDGRSITAVRWGDSLWYRADGQQVLVASEPFEPARPDDPGGWTEVPEHSLLTATRSGVGIAPLSPDPLSPVPPATERNRPHDVELHA